jgi:hypothetical protein
MWGRSGVTALWNQRCDRGEHLAPVASHNTQPSALPPLPPPHRPNTDKDYTIDNGGKQGRLAQLLLQRATDLEQGRPVAPLTQAEMAAPIGTVREMVARTLQSFEAQGLIRLEGGAITILDRAGLATLAEQ